MSKPILDKSKLQPVRGTKDLYGLEIENFNHIISIARNLSLNYGFNEIATPIFEFSEVYERNLGETSDIISKEVYKFPDRGNNFLTLRPEFTAGVVRALIFNGELGHNLPQKLFSFGPVFRYDRPQKGRQRQFHQINFEAIGQEDSFSDAEIIILASKILENLGVLSKTTLQINSLGSEQTKLDYQNALLEYFTKYQNDLSADSQNRLSKNPLRILDSKDSKDIEIAQNSPQINNFYRNQEKKNLENILKLLSEFKVNYQINSKLVRGLDYYTSTVFEFITNDLGAQNTILAGGRYDNLVGKMGGQNLPAIGFGAGIERLMLLNNFQFDHKRPIFVIYISPNEVNEAFKICLKLREGKIYSEMLFAANFKRQFKKANSLNSIFAIIVGEEELKNGQLTVKNFDLGSEEKVEIDKIQQYLINLL